MKKDEQKKSLADKYLEDISLVGELVTDDFFYTRLKARMENEQTNGNWYLPVKPAVAIAIGSLLLIINSFMLSQKTNNTTNDAALTNFANMYNSNFTSELQP